VYLNLDITKKQNIDRPFFALDYDYYNSKRSRVCWEAFRKDIGLTKFLGEQKWLGSFLFYEGDELVEVKRVLD